MNRPARFLYLASRLAFALVATLSLRCGSDETGAAPPGASGAAGQPDRDEPGGASSSSVCEPGATRECVGPAACHGGQACLKDGSGWGGCDCGDGPSGNEAGAGGNRNEPAGGAGAGGSAGCRPAPQRGCEQAEKCTLVAEAATQSLTFACVPNGTKADGDACALRPDGTDDCAKGLLCNGVGTVPRCQPYCDVANAAACDTICTGLNVTVHPNGPMPSGYGVCQPGCDLLEQDCGDGDACVFVVSPYPVCAKAGTAAPGDACVYYDDCELGSACVLTNATKTGSMCTPLCQATQTGSCEAEGDTCIAFPMLYDSVSEDMLTTGLCYPCALLGIEECDLLAPGGCAESSDCAPLLASTGFEYQCDTGAGVCVMAEPR